MTVIYEPAGRAREYADLALNLYAGCRHGCRYCYVPAVLRKTREEFHAGARARPRILEQLRKEAPAYSGDPREVLLSFTSDCYQAEENVLRLTRQALEVLADNGVRSAVLTKAPGLAIERDLDVLVRARTRFGVTVVSLEERFRADWEPGAPSVEVRLSALRMAAAAGLRTWVSVEPVISPVAAYDVLRECARIGVGDVRIGKLNHMPQMEAQVDWREFAQEAVRICQGAGLRFYLKDDLRRWL